MADLNRNELEVMRVLWARKGPLKPAEIEAQFSWPIENATLRSVLAVLLEKGRVARSRQGKAFYYQAVGSPRGALARMARMMAHVFTGGSTADLIARLIKTEKLSAAEIEELRRIAAAKARGGSGVGGRKERG